MKIQNKTSVPTIKRILTISMFFTICISIYAWALFAHINAGYSINEIITLIINQFTIAAPEVKILYVFFLFLPIILFEWLLYVILKRIIKIVSAQREGLFDIEYFDFRKDYVKIILINNECIKISYPDIDVLHFTFIGGFGYRPYERGPIPCISDTNIKITSNQIVYRINSSFLNINKIYEIISITKKIKKMEYDFKSNLINFFQNIGQELQYNIEKNITNILINNYKLPFLVRIKQLQPTQLFLLWFLILFMFGICLALNINLLFPTSKMDTNYIFTVGKGFQYWQNHQYEQAMDEYNKALKIYNNDSTLYRYRASAYYDTRQYKNAIKEAQLAIKYNQDIYYKIKYKNINTETDVLTYPYQILGNSYYELGDYEQALVAFKHILHKNVDSATRNRMNTLICSKNK